ncbi:MAG TPA: PTS sugar transporter subunit IIA [Anaerolineaceae bacterium]|nr:PTS sugar transporter subunit IIA [Anaerolineaceae bacterium]
MAASHGTFASGIKSSLDVLLGKSENVTVIDAYLGQESVEDQLDAYFRSIPETEQVIMLSDIYGGSVNQKMYLRLARPNTFLITGINLALVLQLLMETGPLSLERLRTIVEEGQRALMLVEFQSAGVEDEDFFGESK